MSTISVLYCIILKVAKKLIAITKCFYTSCLSVWWMTGPLPAHFRSRDSMFWRPFVLCLRATGGHLEVARNLVLTIMDIIRKCLSNDPVPCLAPAFAAFKFIYSSIKQVKASQAQLEALAQSFAQLLQTLDEEYRAGQLLYANTLVALADLSRSVPNRTPRSQS